MRTNIYLEKFRRLLTQNKIDALLIYANGYDDRFMRALTGTYSILQDYLFITRTDFVISEPGYLIPETKRRTNIELIPADGENLVIEPIEKILGSNKRIGIIGNCRFRDVEKLKPSLAIDLTTQADEIIKFKTDEFIEELEKRARLLTRLLNSTKISPSRTQEDIAANFHARVAKQGYNLSFPVCITSGEDLRISTCLSPKNKLIRNSDTVCIDVGLKQDIFITDMTRMFFLRNPEAETIYRKLISAHREIVDKFISPELKWKRLINEYQRKFDEIPGTIRMLKENFGHGIGFGLHEQPMIDQSQEIIGKNIVFTIEPTVVTKFGMMRFEDMVDIDSRGEVKIITI